VAGGGFIADIILSSMLWYGRKARDDAIPLKFSAGAIRQLYDGPSNGVQ
jgi:hypothetical protein